MTVETALARLLPSQPAEKPVLLVLAGPNGAGKTTFYKTYLAQWNLPYISPDLIAKEAKASGEKISDYQAARLAERQRRDLVAKRRSFCFETVLSDGAGSKVRFLKEAQTKGYAVRLIFIGIGDVEVSRARVSQRVSEGGHNVPDEKIVQRFPRTLKNLREAIRFVDYAFLFDNDSLAAPYQHIATCVAGRLRELSRHALPRWARDILPPLI